MGSRVFNTNGVMTVDHGLDLNLPIWTIAMWVKRTGVGGTDFRYVGKASTNTTGQLQVTGQSDQSRVRGRQFSSLTITQSFVPLNEWVCLFTVMSLGGEIRIYKYTGSSVVEATYADAPNTASVIYNTSPLYFGRQSNLAGGYNGKMAHVVIDGSVWDTEKMLAFAEGEPPSESSFYWPMQGESPEPNQGLIEGYSASITNVTFDEDDGPPVDYSPEVLTGFGNSFGQDFGNGVNEETNFYLKLDGQLLPLTFVGLKLNDVVYSLTATYKP